MTSIGVSSHNLARAGLFEALGCALVGLHLGHKSVLKGIVSGGNRRNSRYCHLVRQRGDTFHSVTYGLRQTLSAKGPAETGEPGSTTEDVPTTIDQYREAKSQYLKLRNQAKKELIARFHELSGELLRVQRELLDDFGEKITISNKPKKVRAKAATVPAEPEAPEPAKVAAIQKLIERQKKKLADTQAADKPTKTVQDRLYELEDELRLLKGQ